MTAWGNTTDRILLMLADSDLTKLEICAKLGLTHDDVSSVLTRLRKPSKQFGKRVYICDYTRTAQGKRLYLRPIFTAGSRKDAQKPAPFTTQERSIKSYRKKAAVRRSKIFHTIEARL